VAVAVLEASDNQVRLIAVYGQPVDLVPLVTPQKEAAAELAKHDVLLLLDVRRPVAQFGYT
jgi:hypothetical protein